MRHTHKYITIAVLPLMLLGTLVLLRVIEKSPPTPIATRADVERTLDKWATADREAFVSVEDSRALEKVLWAELGEQEMLTPEQVSAGVAMASGLLRSLHSGDYDSFRLARLPVDLPVLTVAEPALRRFSAIEDRTAGPLEHYRSIWEKTFEDRALWNNVNITGKGSYEFERLLAPPKITLPMIEEGVFAMSSHVSSPFDYKAMQENEIEETGHLMIWRWSFMAECPPADGTRPFRIVSMWNESQQVWVPLQLSHQFAQNPTRHFRFF